MQEILDVVDEDNQIVGSAPFEEVFEKRLNHRRVHVLIFNDKGELFLQQLGSNKKFCPGHWSTSAAVNLRKGEAYEDAAVDELKKQLDIEASLTKIAEFTYDHYKMRKFIEVFRCVHSGPFTLNLDEIADGRWFSVSDVKDMVKKNQLVHPELAHIIDKLYS